MRELARYVAKMHGSTSNHTSINKYANAVVGNPNREGGRVLKELAPFIYRNHEFKVSGHGMDRFKRVIHQEPQSRADYWTQPGVTYADDWEAFVLLGTSAGDRTERRLDEDGDTAPLILFNQIKRMRDEVVPIVASAIGMPASTLSALKGGDMALNKNEFRDLREIIYDFLVRVTVQKPDQWDLPRMANALRPFAPFLTEERLQQLIDGAAPEERDTMNLSSLFKLYGVDWEPGELYARGFAHQSQQRSLPLDEHEDEQCNDGEHCHAH